MQNILATILSVSDSIIVTVCAAIIGSFILYLIHLKIKSALIFRVGTMLFALAGTMAIAGLLVGKIELNLQTDPIGSLVLTTIVLSALILLGYGFYVVLFRPLMVLTEVSRKLAQGDVTVKVPIYNRADEIGYLSESLREMLSFLNLQGLVEKIRNISNQLSISSQELASSAEEVNATSEEISSISQQMSQGAQQQADQVNVVVRNSKDLESSFNQEIKKILVAAETIESISSQVNMLALNASIEAARAGEYGRGFAVVADNIRRLADESKNSLDQVNEIILSLKQTISTKIVQIGNAIQNVASVSEETSAGAEEATAATEEQAASMQEMSAAAQQLATLATELNNLIKNFQINDISPSDSIDDFSKPTSSLGTIIRRIKNVG
ncbi:MAG: methyl-accepting chemotaxis protein [Candidatus Hermodarchaeota archaeon]